MDLSSTTARRRLRSSAMRFYFALSLIAFLSAGLLYASSRAIYNYSPLWDTSFELDLEARQEKEPSFSSSAEIGSDILEKQPYNENAPPVVTQSTQIKDSNVDPAEREMGEQADAHVIVTHDEQLRKDDEPTKLKDASGPSCISANSQEWLASTRYGNTPLNYSQPEFPLKGPLLDNLSALLLDAQPICHKQSPLMAISDKKGNQIGNDDEVREVRMWKIRLMYLSLYYHQNHHAMEEARERQRLQSVQGEEECNDDMSKHNVSTFDYECKDAKFMVVELRTSGLGSILTRDMYNVFTAAIAMDRVMIVHNGGRDWGLSSCPRGDYQCTFQPLSGCVLTNDEINQAPIVKYGQVNKFAAGHGESPEKDAKVVRYGDPATKRPVATKPRVLVEVHRISNLIIDELDPTDDRVPILRKAAQDILSFDAPAKIMHFTHETSKWVIAFLLYFMRPTLDKGNQLKSFTEFDLPSDFDSAQSFGVPIRGSDKCNQESECLKFPSYMRLLKSKWYEEGFADKYGQGGSNITFDVLITSETKDIVEQAYAFSNNSKYMSQFPFTPRWITNTNDIRQGNGNNGRFLKMGVGGGDVLMSILSSFKLQMNAASTIGNCCSNFHQVIFHLLRGGCGAEYGNNGQCLQSRNESIYQLCCQFKTKPRCVNDRMNGLREEFNDVNMTLSDAEQKMWDEL